MQYQGHVAGGVIVLDNNAALPEGATVRVELIDRSTQSTIADRLQNVIGQASALPADMAEQHDHYLHGSPKR